MASYKKSVENFCRDCCYDPTEAGSWRKQVEDCTITKCALYDVRPKTTETIRLDRESGRIPVETVE